VSDDYDHDVDGIKQEDNDEEECVSIVIVDVDKKKILFHKKNRLVVDLEKQFQ